MKSCGFLLLSFLTIVRPDPAQSEPVRWDANGHWYEGFADSVTWDEATNIAAGMTWMGVSGHLATLTSQEENDFVFGTIPSAIRTWAWLGGYQDPPNTPDPTANWHWVTGEPWSFTNWHSGEPNDVYDPEAFLEFWNTTAQWNDGASPQSDGPYIVEFPVGFIGACCFEDGSCLVLRDSDCEDQGQMFMGEGTSCDPSPCHWGACCLFIACEVYDPAECANHGGTYQGDGVPCEPNPCPTSGVKTEPSGIVRVLRAIPNPAPSGCRINFTVSQSSLVTVSLFDSAGRMVRQLHDGALPIGECSLSWDGRDDRGEMLPAGVYFSRVHAGTATAEVRIVLAK